MRVVCMCRFSSVIQKKLKAGNELNIPLAHFGSAPYPIGHNRY